MTHNKERDILVVNSVDGVSDIENSARQPHGSTQIVGTFAGFPTADLIEAMDLDTLLGDLLKYAVVPCNVLCMAVYKDYICLYRSFGGLGDQLMCEQ